MLKLLKTDKNCKCDMCRKNEAKVRFVNEHSTVYLCEVCGAKRALMFININNDIIKLSKQAIEPVKPHISLIRKLQYENKKIIEQLGVLYD